MYNIIFKRELLHAPFSSASADTAASAEIAAVSTRKRNDPKPTGRAPAAIIAFNSSSVKSPSGPMTIRPERKSSPEARATSAMGGAPAAASNRSWRPSRLF